VEEGGDTGCELDGGAATKHRVDVYTYLSGEGGCADGTERGCDGEGGGGQSGAV